MTANNECDGDKNVEATACPNKDSNRRNCSCANTECVRNGVCCTCIRFHRERGNRPACIR